MNIWNISDRTFQLWEYRVSHGSLLIRSPKSPGKKTNLDIICLGVEYLSLPRFLRGLEIMEPTSEELNYLGTLLDKTILPSSVRIFASSGHRFPVVATSFKKDENELDIFDSPFE